MTRPELLRTLQEGLQKERARRKKVADSYTWSLQARPNQLPPEGDWHTWLILAGRGFGKTRTGAETLRFWVHQEGRRHLALIGETELETRHVMVEGPSGILAVHPPQERPLYEPSKRQLVWPNGAIATCFSAEAYEQLRGPQFDGAWVDELAKFPESEKVWDQLMFGLRLGPCPRVIVTTTPRSTPFLKKLLRTPEVVVTRGTTFENEANLAAPFLSYIQRHYANSPLGRQEIHAEIVEDHAGALWTHALIKKATDGFRETPLSRLIIAVDPAVTHGRKSDETGIIVAGITPDGIGVVLEDLSCRTSSHVWIRTVIEAYHRLNADRVVAEINIGGELVEQLLRTYDPSISYKGVRASRTKAIRAEPIVALYEQGRIWHCAHFPILEEQMCSYIPGQTHGSPDRLDALVWALTELILECPPFMGKIWFA